MDPEDEQPLAAMARTNLFRAEESCLNRETQLVKVSPNPLRPTGREHAGDVFDDAAPCAGLDENAAERAPQVARVVSSEPFAGEAVRLARDAANDEIHLSTPPSAVEGSGVAPNRRRSHEARAHRRDQMGDGESLPLHHTDSATSRKREFESHVEPSASGADREGSQPHGRGSSGDVGM